ncbi:MAG: DedA family protein [Candidatus Hydrogenedentes bacterium]|nr:DedA family protein [Candidatus Hydrogenedentota bacterium]
MDFIKSAIDLFLHLDKHMNEIISQYGAFTHVILFIIVFCETGLVVTPFLPGDSLLFAAGVFAASGSLDIWILLISLSIAAILGDTVNYKLGQVFGEHARFINPKHIARTHEFYERYGPSTIIIARFVPIVRTFAPFVAGVGKMSYAKFLLYNVVGGLLWVFLLTLGGYFFANVPIVKENFSFVVVAIIIISVMPAVFEFGRAWLANRKASDTSAP